MNASTTVVFADLSGSTGVFESHGNALATEAITSLTQWIGGVCIQHSGRVVKTLGDGVLAVFPTAGPAVDAVVEMQRDHQSRMREWPKHLRMKLKVGIAAGEVVELDSDCYGDAVNVASRLSDVSGPEQILATDTVVAQISRPPYGVRFRNLGPIPLRGKSEARVVFRVEWREDADSTGLTQPAPLELTRKKQEARGSVQLSCLTQHASFGWDDLPIEVGRASEAHFIVNDSRVSRLHARIDRHNGVLVLSDVSSYGTWLRFEGSPTEISLRRDECVLHANGEISLGAPFEDLAAPRVRFQLVGP
jgi:class 3 adenylate cyclase